jgi:Leu/Phe-tRNA-protein transferase
MELTDVQIMNDFLENLGDLLINAAKLQKFYAKIMSRQSEIVGDEFL